MARMVRLCAGLLLGVGALSCVEHGICDSTRRVVLEGIIAIQGEPSPTELEAERMLWSDVGWYSAVGIAPEFCGAYLEVLPQSGDEIQGQVVMRCLD